MARGRGRGRGNGRAPQQRFETAHHLSWIALPLDLFRYILQYLTCREICLFDNSLLHPGVRAHYLQATEKMTLPLPPFMDPQLRSNMLLWLVLRRFSVKTWSTHLQPLETTLLSNSRESLTQLAFNSVEVTDADLLSLSLPNLITIRFFHCWGTTSHGLRSFLINCPKVTSLRLSVNPLSPDAIEVLGDCCPNLTDLDVSSTWFHNGALSLLTKSKLQLKSLNLIGSRTTDSLSPLIEKMPSLRRIQQNHLTRAEDWRCIFERVALPGILSGDPDSQRMGLSHFSDFLYFQINPERAEMICSMKAVIDRLIDFLSLNFTRVGAFFFSPPLSHLSIGCQKRSKLNFISHRRLSCLSTHRSWSYPKDSCSRQYQSCQTFSSKTLPDNPSRAE